MSEFILDVEQSYMQARWVLAPAEQAQIEQIARQYDLPEIVARLLASRGVSVGEVEEFLNPRLGRNFPDPFSLAGMAEAASFIADAIRQNRKIGILGDFDVDGATSTALLVRFLRHCGMEAPFYIPDRLKEGYGPSEKAFQTLKEQGAELVIICDCGITAFEPIKSGRAMGLDIIVIDHHQAEDTLPEANHVINPKRQDDTSGFDMLAACGVTFLTAVAVNARLRETGWFKERGIAEAPLKDMLDIVALGTVCDMVPLKGPNRLFVRTGLSQMAGSDNPGLRALSDVAGVKSEISPYHCGFIFGPRINAGSRVHKSDLGAKLLATEDAEEARNIAWTLNDCNDKRKEIEAEMLAHATGLVEKEGLEHDPVIVVGHEDWHPGLSGLVAGRLKEKYGRPAVVVTYAPGDSGVLEGRGSGRSVPGVNIGAAFIDARNHGLVTKGGGHAMAAGFTLQPDQVKAFRIFLLKHVGDQLAGKISVTETMIDGVLSVRGAKPDFVRLIQDNIGPFGQEHPEPVFALPGVRLHNVKIVGKDHISCLVSDWEGGPRLKAIAFRAKDTPLGENIMKNWKGHPFHLAGYFKLDSWNGQERAELHIQDAAPVLTAASAVKTTQAVG